MRAGLKGRNSGVECGVFKAAQSVPLIRDRRWQQEAEPQASVNRSSICTSLNDLARRPSRPPEHVSSHSSPAGPDQLGAIKLTACVLIQTRDGAPDPFDTLSQNMHRPYE